MIVGGSEECDLTSVMWSLKPLNSPPSTCPGCNSDNAGFDDYQFTGLHILGIGYCTNCGMKYYHNWPIGHGADFPISFNHNGTAGYPDKAAVWLAKPLIKAIKGNLSTAALVDRCVKKEISQVLLLNCLDPCYGHVLWKLFNAFHYRDIESPKGLVVLIPKNCAWLVPDFVAEVWSVEADLGSLKLPIPAVDTFIRELFNSYESVHVLPAYTHIDHHNLDLTQFLRVTPFNLADFYLHDASITFIWREDRYWLRSKWEEWLSLVATKYSITWLKAWFLSRQLSSIKKIAYQVLQQIPTSRFNVTGLGTWGVFPDCINDLRQLKTDREIEMEWCQTYAQSQLVIGVHGSNMLIPTALAAGFIELLPRNKIPFITEDILMKHPARFQTFLGRHLDLFTPAKVIANHVTSIFKDFDYLYKNTFTKP